MEDRFCAFSVKFSNDGSEIIASWGAAGFVCGMTRCGTLSPFCFTVQVTATSTSTTGWSATEPWRYSTSANKLFPFLPLPLPLSTSPFFPSYTPLSPRTHRLMHIRMMLMQSRLQTRVLRSSSQAGTMGYARCGTGGPSLRHTVALLASWRDTRTELPSLTLRYACPHIHTLISSLNTVYIVMQIHTHTHALTHTSHTHTYLAQGDSYSFPAFVACCVAFNKSASPSF